MATLRLICVRAFEQGVSYLRVTACLQEPAACSGALPLVIVYSYVAEHHVIVCDASWFTLEYIVQVRVVVVCVIAIGLLLFSALALLLLVALLSLVLALLAFALAVLLLA